MYVKNYVRHDMNEKRSEEIPIRWMAPKSIENEVFDERTDVVSIYFFIDRFVTIARSST